MKSILAYHCETGAFVSMGTPIATFLQEPNISGHFGGSKVLEVLRAMLVSAYRLSFACNA